MLRSVKSLAAGVGIALAAATSVAGPALADTANSDSTRIAEYQAFVATHSDDYAGRDALAMQLFGHHEYVWFDGDLAPRTGTGAAAYIKSWHSTHDNAPRTATSPNIVHPDASLPSDTFSVSRSVVDSGTNQIVTGSWSFKSSWAGQADPVDLATLQFDMSSCHRFTSYSSSTTSGNGHSTNRGTLRDGGAATHSPIWNIADSESGFVMQAAKGAVSVAVSQGSCSAPSQIGYDFKYEANQGGGVTGVSASFGLLSVSYSGQDYALQKGTAAGYFTR